MNPERDELIRVVGRQLRGDAFCGDLPRARLAVHVPIEAFHESAAHVVDAVLAVLQQDKTTEDQVRPCGFKHGVSLDEMAAEDDQVVSAEGSQAADPVRKAAEKAAAELKRQAAAWLTVAPILEAHVYEPREDGYVWNAFMRWNRGSHALVAADRLRSALKAAGSMAEPSEGK